MIKVWLYILLTTLIIVLSKLRFRFGNAIGWELRNERELQNRIYFEIKKGFLLECCDCGLSHKLKQHQDYIDCIPERPRRYRYILRFGS